MRGPLQLLARLSLTARLAIFFAATASAVVLGLGALIFVATNQHFADMDHEALQEKRLLIEEILRRANSEDDARWRLGEALSFHADLFARVTAAHGGVIYRSPALTAGASHPTRAAGLQRTTSGSEKTRGAPLRTLTFTTTADFSPTPIRAWIGIDTQLHAQFLRRMQRGLLVYMVAAIALCALLAWLAARQGLAPLQRMKSRAAVVAGSRLDERMPAESVPPEMADLARELNRMLDRLQSDFEHLAEFSANIAHELRTPLTNLLTQTQVTLAAPRDAATYRDVLGSNAEELERLGRMVSDMLFLAKTEHGVELPHRERFSARDEARALLDFHAAVAEDRHIRMEIRGDGDVVGDRLMFRRAVSNLLSNALRHTPERGVVTVRIASDARATTVAVENTGMAIAAEHLPHLFERFYRVDAARARADVNGTGLGLAITQAIVQAHGGSASATSADGRTRFCLVFPRQPGGRGHH